MLQEIRCPNCNEFICLSSGEVKRTCDRCKKEIHVVATSAGVYGMSEIAALIPKQIALNRKLANK